MTNHELSSGTIMTGKVFRRQFCCWTIALVSPTVGFLLKAWWSQQSTQFETIPMRRRGQHLLISRLSHIRKVYIIVFLAVRHCWEANSRSSRIEIHFQKSFRPSYCHDAASLSRWSESRGISWGCVASMEANLHGSLMLVAEVGGVSGLVGVQLTLCNTGDVSSTR